MWKVRVIGYTSILCAPHRAIKWLRNIRKFLYLDLRIMLSNFPLASAGKGGAEEDWTCASCCAPSLLMAPWCRSHVWLRKSSWQNLENNQKSDGKGNSLKGDVTKLDFHCLFALQSQELIINNTWMKQTCLGRVLSVLINLQSLSHSKQESLPVSSQWSHR